MFFILLLVINAAASIIITAIDGSYDGFQIGSKLWPFKYVVARSSRGDESILFRGVTDSIASVTVNLD
jgi:hypothetical protein